VDQSESALGPAVSTAQPVIDWSSEFVSLTEVGPNLGAHTKYNALNQLCYAASSNSNACSSPPSGNTLYKYDAADNMIQKGPNQQVFNTADELCWTAASTAACTAPPTGATTYQFDARGNRIGVSPTGGQAQTLTFDQADRLTKYTAASTTSYGYNGDSLRMCKVSGSSSQPCQASGNTPYVWDLSSGVPALIKDGTTAYVYGPRGLPLEQVSVTTTLWLHHDQIGSTRLVTDAAGASQATYTYDPFGSLVAATGTITNPLRFAGQYWDSESSLYYLRARYYDPATAQFISIDPLADFALPYGYSESNPLNMADPTGLIGIAWPSLTQYGDKLSWKVIIGEMPWDRSLSFTYQLYHDNVPYFDPAPDQNANKAGGGLTMRSGTVPCLAGHWELEVELETAGFFNDTHDCAPPDDSCGGLVTASMGMGASAPGCQPGFLPIPWPNPLPIPFPIPDPNPIPIPVGFLAWNCNGVL
jgi:RHS repeat-associated protein